MHCNNNEYLKKVSELGALLQENHFQQKKSRRVLKDRVIHAELEAQHLRKTVESLLLSLKEEQSKYHLLEASVELLKTSQTTGFIIREHQVIEKERDLNIRAEALSAKAEECETRLRSLKCQEKNLLEREEQLQRRQATFETGIICAHKQAEMENLRSQRTREQADEIFEGARCAALAVKRQKLEHELSYKNGKQCFYLEKEECSKRLCIVRQEIDSLMHLLSLRLGHIRSVEARVFEGFRLREYDILSRSDLISLREKEFFSRQQREQDRINEEKEKIHVVMGSMRQECNLILEKVRLLGRDNMVDTEQSQLDRLRDLEKLFSL